MVDRLHACIVGGAATYVSAILCWSAWHGMHAPLASPRAIHQVAETSLDGERVRPDPLISPGATNPMVTQDNTASTICVPGWTRTIRPSEEYTSALKRRQIVEYGYADRRMSDYEEDHPIPLSLGGAPSDPRNLWPQPRWPSNGWGAAKKDRLEHRLNALVCWGMVPLADAQAAIADDWIAAYQRFVAAPDGED